MTPSGGSLPESAAPAVRQTVATFTPTQVVHPDEVWSPRGGELTPPDRPFSPSRAAYAGAESERPVPAAYMGERPIVGNLVDTHRAVRAALRPGLVG
ncbi:MAG: hypothetical protein ACRDND_07530 [Streptosporangiaceae bacterium]